jgi:NTE family protein
MDGIGSSTLYNKARYGTKRLVTDYIEEVSAALEYLASNQTDDIRNEEKLEFFNRASHCVGRSALMMSGAGTLFYFHLGVVKALWEQDLLPSILSGSSGGALIAAMVGTHSHEELNKIFDPGYITIEVEQEESLMKKLSLFSGQKITQRDVREMIDRLIPDLTFLEAFHKTGYQVNISVAPAELHQTSRLLNAVTSPDVMIRDAVLASGSVPGLYPPVTLMAKSNNGSKKPYLPSRQWVDGSLTEDLPIKRLSRLYGVNHTIVSQTNPLALPFVNVDSKSTEALDVIWGTGLQTTKSWSLAFAKILQSSTRKNIVVRKFLNRYISLLSQTYTGDINILPSNRINSMWSVVSPRTKKEALKLIRDGERATWPVIERIRIQTRVSRCLDRIIRESNHTMPRDQRDPNNRSANIT